MPPLDALTEKDNWRYPSLPLNDPLSFIFRRKQHFAISGNCSIFSFRPPKCQILFGTLKTYDLPYNRCFLTTIQLENTVSNML